MRETACNVHETISINKIKIRHAHSQSFGECLKHRQSRVFKVQYANVSATLADRVTYLAFRFRLARLASPPSPHNSLSFETDTMFCAFDAWGSKLESSFAAKKPAGLQDVVSTKRNRGWRRSAFAISQLTTSLRYLRLLRRLSRVLRCGRGPQRPRGPPPR